MIARLILNNKDVYLLETESKAVDKIVNDILDTHKPDTWEIIE